MIDSVYRKDGNYYPKGLLEKSYVIEYIGIYCSNCEKEYYDEECIIFFFLAWDFKVPSWNIRVF